jgi:predicted PurR-regulated permease PerM
MSPTNGNIIHISSSTIIRTILIGILFYFLYFIRDILMVILTAIVLASAVEPGTRWFVARRIPRVLSVLVIYIVSAVVFATTFYFFFLPLLNESANFLRGLPEYSADAAALTVPGEGGGFLGGFSQSLSLPAIIDKVNETVRGLSSGFLGTIDIIFGGILSFFLIIVLSFYLAVQEDGVGKFLRIVTPIQHEPYVADLWRRSKAKIGYWMQGQLLLAIIVTVLVFLGLTLLDVRHALLLSFLAGLFELIPIFGAFLAAAPAIFFSFVDGGLSFALVVAGFYLIIQQFESQLIYPLVVKKVVGVPPIISILALVIGAKIAGFLGILLSVPLAAVFMELLNDFERKKVRGASS